MIKKDHHILRTNQARIFTTTKLFLNTSNYPSLHRIKDDSHKTKFFNNNRKLYRSAAGTEIGVPLKTYLETVYLI